MKILFAYLFPVPVFFVESLKGGRAGVSYGYFIQILKQHKDNYPLLKHELMHAKQFYRFPLLALLLIGLTSTTIAPMTATEAGGLFVFALFVHPVLKRINKRYYYVTIIEAHREQLRHIPDARKRRAAEHFAEHITTRYGLGIGYTKERVIKDLGY